MSYGNENLNDLKWLLLCSLYKKGTENLTKNELEITFYLLKEESVIKILTERLNKLDS